MLSVYKLYEFISLMPLHDINNREKGTEREHQEKINLD